MLQRAAALAGVVATVVALQVSTGRALAQTAPAQHRVLSFYGMRPDEPGVAVSDRVYQQTLRERLGGNTAVDYYFEYLDRARTTDPRFEGALIEFLEQKYQDKGFDLIIANGSDTTGFLASYANRLFPGVPIVFNGSDQRPVPNSTGFQYALNMRETLELALRLQPDTNLIYAVGGVNDSDRQYEAIFRQQMQQWNGPRIVYLLGGRIKELKESLSRLPPRSIVFYLAFTEDADGVRLSMAEFVDELTAAANVPVYSWARAHLNRGIVGGRHGGAEAIASHTAALAVRVLQGERPEDIPVAKIDIGTNFVDWRQLRRWGIAESRLPPGTVVLFREPSVFDRYWPYILIALGIMIAETTLISRLLVQRRNRLRAEAALRESEQRFRIMADTAPVMIWRSDANQMYDFFNMPWLQFTGRTLAEELGDGWVEGIHGDDRANARATYTRAFDQREPFRMEYRLRRHDGAYRWVIDIGVPRYSPSGDFSGYVGSCLDITERRQAEEGIRASEAALRTSHQQIRDLAGRLITAQETERARIARELHDDVSQELAAIAINISGIKRRPEAMREVKLLAALSMLQQRTTQVTEGIRRISHDLHPSVLEHSGLVDALRSHCTQCARQHGLQVAFRADPAVGNVDRTPALCLYRVAQEALHNVVKHAGARSVDVRLTRSQGTLSLTISDDGRGFDVVVARRADGLGLRSIEERVRLAGGRFTIESDRIRGTTVSVELADAVGETARAQSA